MTKVKNDVEIAVTHACNWDCDYCLVDTHNAEPIKYGAVMQEIKKIRGGSNVTISGGEPGLLSSEKLSNVISKLRNKECKIDILTNGLVFEKHGGLIKNFEEILYHCVEELPGDIQHLNVGKKVIYVLVTRVDDYTNGNVLKMIEKYPNIKFLLSHDVRGGGVEGVSEFWAFLKKYEDKLHARTKSEFIKNIGRI